jgi:nucleotide-binding universal stress UspA family protein
MFEKILVALDESEHAKRVLDIAQEVAVKFDAEVRVVHVLETAFVGKAGMLNLESSEEKHTLVDDAVAALVAAGVKATGTVRANYHGRVALEIHDEARLVGADLIVTGTHGLGSIAGMLMGSTTQKLLHVSEASVLVVP